ncbi:MAG TPA: Rieske (2Fe-2S) protein [Candidatus Acidoferrales bacterium]|nr:Rieske (2Fe-2S) protein [Candidatus Acidoferrales bacterium]
MEFVRVVDLATIPSGSARAVIVGRYEVALFNVGGSYYALENACPHQGGPLVDGWVENGTVTCPWHAWCFDLRTGSLTLGPFAAVPRFEVRLEQDGVYLSTEPVAQ